MDLAIQFNQSWVRGIDHEIALDKKTCLPHITLAMGVIEEKQIMKAQGLMAKIAGRFSPLELTIDTIKIVDQPKGEKISSLRINQSAELKKLHEMVMDTLVPMLSYDDVKKEMFYSPPPVDRLPEYWIKNYVRNKVRDNYDPHITLGIGLAKSPRSPITFTAGRFAMCHLGIYCTCRTILAEVSLTA